MAVIDIPKTRSLDGTIIPEALPGPLYATENLAHKFIITATRGGSEVTLTGTVTGRFVNANGQAIILTESGSVAGISSGKAWVQLTSGCYLIPGRFELYVFVQPTGGEKTMVYSCTGDVKNIGGVVIDPDDSLPDYGDIASRYSALQDAIDDAEAAAASAIATAETAASGAVTQPQNLMRGAWTSPQFDALESGGVNTSTGANTTSNYYARTAYIYVQRPLLFRMASSDYKYDIWTYSSKSASSAVECLTGGAYIVASSTLIPYSGTGFYIRVGVRAVADSVELDATARATVRALMSFTELGDETLTQPGMAAEARTVGAEIALLKRSMGGMTRNLWLEGDVEVPSTNGFITARLTEPLPAGTYKISAVIDKASSTTDAQIIFTGSRETAFSSADYCGTAKIAYGGRQSATLTLTDTAYMVRLCSSESPSESAGIAATWRDIQIEAGSTVTPYVEPLPVNDVHTRELLATLEPTGDQTDRAAEIVALLTKYGECRLGKGDYYISPLTMPDSTTLSGRGDATKLRLIEGPGGAAVRMKDRCTVKDISFIGASSDITLTGDVEGTGIVDTGAANQWGDGDISIDGTGNDGFRHMVMTNPLPAGTYRISARVSSTDTNRTTSLFGLSASQTTAISSLLVSLQLERRGPGDDPYVTTFTLTETAYSVRLAASDNTTRSAGDTATFSDITITRIGDRYGVAWYGEYHMSGNTRVYDYKPYYGVLTGCRFSRFSGAGVLMHDTSASVNNGLMITNCGATNCNIGLYIRESSEFIKIANCTIDHNYFGLLGRGGNMVVSNCGIDQNKIGIQIDEDEGSNGGHGSITGCTINHNGPVETAPQGKGYGLIVKSTGGMFVSNCQFYYDKVWLLDTGRNTITGCMFSGSYSDGEDYSGVDIEDGSASFVFGCIFRNSNHKIKLINNSASKVANCYYNNGTEVTPTVVTQ